MQDSGITLTQKKTCKTEDNGKCLDKSQTACFKGTWQKCFDLIATGSINPQGLPCN